ncbi:antitoxin MazE-like protein [Methylobacterium sp. sgz302541]|uniref:antitoxin MazE-like protein n=1 Tax=unclassified Methylobacterium TaxID=2615210 RepID=UPI003D32E8C1
MANAGRTDGLSKFQRYRLTRQANGMKLLRFWVPDPRTEAFQADIARQTARLRAAPEEAEALRFIEAAMDWPPP